MGSKTHRKDFLSDAKPTKIDGTDRLSRRPVLGHDRSVWAIRCRRTRERSVTTFGRNASGWVRVWVGIRNNCIAQEDGRS